MQPGLLDLSRSPADVHRLAATADGPAGVLVEQVAPQPDDAGRVAARLGHVDERDLLGVVAEFLAQQLDPLLRDRDQHHVADVDPGADVRRRPVEEVLVIGVDERVVSKTAGTPGPGSLALSISTTSG